MVCHVFAVVTFETWIFLVNFKLTILGPSFNRYISYEIMVVRQGNVSWKQQRDSPILDSFGNDSSYRFARKRSIRDLRINERRRRVELLSCCGFIHFPSDVTTIIVRTDQLISLTQP
jgi:hypothetical protein